MYIDSFYRQMVCHLVMTVIVRFRHIAAGGMAVFGNFLNTALMNIELLPCTTEKEPNDIFPNLFSLGKYLESFSYFLSS